MRTLTRRGALVTIAAMAVACTSGSPAPTAAVPGTATSGSAVPVDAWLVVRRAGETDYRVVLAGTREELTRLPLGVPDATWGHLLTVTPGDATTRIDDLVVQPGLGGRSRTVDGAWRLPTVGLDPMPVGVSADGSTVVLVEAGPTPDWGTASSSRFAIVDRTSDADPRVIELPGAFEYDALSADGARLFVAQHIPGPLEDRYQVRVLDTSTGIMDATIIVDKRNLDEAMAGRPIDQERRADGVVLTLYRGEEYPFIHALSTGEAWAVCIDLPARGLDDEAAAADWGLVSTPDGRADLAINATLGLAVEIDPTDLTIRRAADFEPSARGGAILAKFGHQDTGAVGRRVVASPDGSAVFAAGRGGIVRVATADLRVETRSLIGQAVESIALTPDGSTLYALTKEGGRIARLDAATGALIDWLDHDGYDRLLAIVPW